MISRWMMLTTALVTTSGCSGPISSAPDLDETEGAPIVTGADPTAMPKGATFDLRVFGSGFETASRVRIALKGVPTPKVHTNETRFVSSRELVASITTAGDAPPGPYDIEVAGRTGKQGVGTELVDFAPLITGIRPSQAAPLDTVTVSGWNFGSDTSAVSVTFDGREASVIAAEDTTVVAVVPLGVPIGTIVVELSLFGSPKTTRIDLEIAGLFPHIAGISPSTAERGEMVLIWGSNLGQLCFDCSPSRVVISIAGKEVEPPVWFLSPERIVTAVPWELPPGSATLRVFHPQSAIPVEARLTIEHSLVPNVAGRYDLNDQLINVTQVGSRVTLGNQTATLSGGGELHFSSLGCNTAVTFNVNGFIYHHGNCGSDATSWGIRLPPRSWIGSP